MARKVVYEHFKTLEILLDTMENRPLRNEAYKNKDNLASQREEIGEKNPWSGTSDYNEAMQVIKEGYKKPLEKMKKAILKIGQNETYKRPRTKNDYIGFAPNVPNYLMNQPINMINREKQVNKAKTIHLIYSYGASSKVKPNDMIKGGINFISLVNSLEKQGYRVKIDILSSFTTTRTLACFTVNVKEYGQNLNLLKLTFPLVHPAMFRRVGFKWIETTPNLTDSDMVFGYGTPLSHIMGYNTKKEADYLRDHEIIKNENTFYCTVYTAMHNDDIETLAKTIGITK
jgi:hypothetical protein